MSGNNGKGSGEIRRELSRLFENAVSNASYGSREGRPEHMQAAVALAGAIAEIDRQALERAKLQLKQDKLDFEKEQAEQPKRASLPKPQIGR